VENEIKRYFPQATVARLDRDSTARKDAHLRIVDDFRRLKTDILIGTQMVAKGFDFPAVTLVGVISADVALNLPDFRAAERTFQLVAQASGRSGRREQPGEVIVQTYNPDHYSLQAAQEHDYETFFQHELEARREPPYPPFSHLANIIITSAQEQAAIDAANQLASRYRQLCQELGLEVDIMGPAPAPLAKVRDKFRWHILLRSRSHDHLRQLISAVSRQMPRSRKISVAIDVDPASLM